MPASTSPPSPTRACSIEPSVLADALAPFPPIEIGQRQDLLETGDVIARLEKLLALMTDKSQAA
jgi:ATP-dependent Lon protease